MTPHRPNTCHRIATQRGRRPAQAVIAAAAIAAATAGSAHDSGTAHYHSAKDAFQADVERVAREAGQDPASVERVMAFQQRFGDYARSVIERHADSVAAMWMEPMPSARAHIRFVGAVPRDVAEELRRGVGGVNERSVVVAGNALIPLAQQSLRASLAAEGLREAGLKQVMTGFLPSRGQIEVTVHADEGASRREIEDIVGKYVYSQRARGLKGRGATVYPSDLRVIINTGKPAPMVAEHSRGGNVLQDDGNFECTSGWSVSGPNGNGIITAAHCSGLNEYVEPGGSTYSMKWRSQELGDGGDVEYHTTSHIEPAEFNASASEIRDVKGVQWTWFMVGGQVCHYGRMSNNRTCNHEVEAIFVSTPLADANGNIIANVSNMVRATNDTMVGGDSGGGWSWSTTAWGVHSGSNGTIAVFTPVQAAESAVNVQLRLK